MALHANYCILLVLKGRCRLIIVLFFSSSAIYTSAQRCSDCSDVSLLVVGDIASMECGAVVCYSMGAINSLVDEITQMMANHPLLEGLLQDLKRLREDLMNRSICPSKGGGCG